MKAVFAPQEQTAPIDVNDVLASQRSLITPAQLRAAGVSLRDQRIHVDRGDWTLTGTGIVSLCGVPESWHRLLNEATLAAPSAAVTAGTALRVHDVDGYAEYEDYYAICRQGSKPRLPDGFRVWQSRRLEDKDVMTLDGIHTTTLATALAHAAAIDAAELFGRAVDDALRRKVSPGWLQATAERWSGRGVPGSGIMAAALADRCDRRLPRSWFERLARRALAEHGIDLEHEVLVRDRRRQIASLDLADRRWKVGVECQSWAWHATPTARAADAERKRHLTRLGWDIIELWWRDLKKMDTVVADIEQAFARQRVLLPR